MTTSARTLPETPVPRTLVGAPASRGMATGWARVIRTPQDARFQPGDILVIAILHAAWMALLPAAGAIVAEEGSLLADPSIIAREYGVPAVVGVRDATRLIPDGAQLTVDGTGGVVYVGG